MDSKRHIRIAFLRRVYAGATANTEAARNTYIDGIESVAMACVLSGKLLTAAAFGSSSSSYQYLDGMGADMAVELCEWARAYISDSAVADAIADVPSRVRSFSNRTTNLHVIG